MAAKIGHSRHHPKVILFQPVEQCAHRRRYVMLHPDILGQRIKIFPVAFEPEMEMRAGGEPARTDAPDRLAHRHEITNADSRPDL